MKILIVRTFPNILDLNSYNVQEIGLAKALAAKGHQVGVIFYNGKQKSRYEDYQFYKENRQYNFRIYWLRGIGIYKNGFMPKTCSIIKEYDVVQVHEYDQIFSWMLYTAQKKPTLIYHGPYYHEYAKGYNLKCKVFDQLFFRWRDSSQVIALGKSKLASEFLKNKGFMRVHTVGVGVDGDKFIKNEEVEKSCRLEWNQDKFRLLYVGKIEERRNVFFLIDVFEKLQKKYEKMELIIVGSGEQEYVNKFEERIHDLVLAKKIRYFKSASQQELACFYERTNLFFFTSNYEIFGMVLLEAMYFGLPVVSSWNGGSSTLIDDGINGFIMNEFSEKKWISTIASIYEDKDRYVRMTELAKATIRENYVWDKLADKFLEGYREAIQNWENRSRKFCEKE